MKRNTLLKYADQHFKSNPEYLWEKFPNYVVLRHKDNEKWFAIIMNVAGSKLGLKSDEEVDILNVKVRPEYTGSLRKNEAILPAYHMNKEHWVSIVLDDKNLSNNEIYDLLTDSYNLTS